MKNINSLSEEQLLKKIKKNAWIIKYIQNPSEQIILSAIKYKKVSIWVKSNLDSKFFSQKILDIFDIQDILE